MLRALTLACGLLLAPLATAAGEPAGKSVAAPKPAVVAPDILVRETGDALLSRIKADQKLYRKEPEKLYAMVDEVVLKHFDFDTMAMLVLAKNWKSASDEQRRRFSGAFKLLLIKTYSDALLSYSNETIDWGAVQYNKEKDRARVNSRIQAPGAPAIPMQYSLHLTDSGWKVYDVSVDNISLVTNYRGTYTAEIRKNGLDSLIDALESKAG